MIYPVEVEGCEGQKIEVQYRFLIGARLLVDGQPAPKGKMWGTWVLQRNDGRDVLAAWKPQRLGLDVPQLVVAGKVINVVRPLRIYELVWSGLPMILILMPDFLTGMVAGLFGLWANIQIFRTGLHPISKYIVALGISALALGAYILSTTYLK